jgi:glycosyltransferase 2 family protein
VRYFQILLGVAISLGSGYYAFHDVQWEKVSAAFSHMDVIGLLPALAMLALFLLFRAYRWQAFVTPVQAVGLRPFWSATMIGFMANDLLPLRAGEFVRAYALVHLASLRMSTAVATTVLERVWDAVAVAIILVATLSGIPLPNWVQRANYVLLGLCATVLVGGWLLVRQGDASFSRFSPRVAALARNFASGFSVLQSVPQLLWVLFLSLAIWLALGGFYWVLLRACGFSLPLQATFVVLIFTVFASAIPAAPGYLGTYQVAMELALQLYAIPKDAALGFSLIAHAVQYFPVVIVGLIELFRARLPLWPSQLRKEEQERL